LGKGFISNGRGNNVTIFDIKTLKATGTVATEMNPDDITYDAVSKRVLAFNGRSKSVTIIDAKTGQAVTTLMLPGKPQLAGTDGVVIDTGNDYTSSTNEDGLMTIVHQTGGKYDVVENLATDRGARTIARNEKTHRVYLPKATAGQAAAGGRAPYLPDSFKVVV